MLIHNLVATGSLSYNGVNISYVTGSQTSLDGLNQFSASVNTTTGSLNETTGSLNTATGSLFTASGSFSTRVTNIEGNYATTGSNVFLGAQTVCANITSTGTIIAQTLNVQQVTSSVVYSSGSNIFGCALINTQQFTGSVTMTGSLAVFTAGTTPEFQVAIGGTTKGNALTDVHQVTGSLRITGSVIGVGNTCVTSICSPAIVGGTVSGTTGVFSGQVCANSNLTAAGTIYGRTTNNFPTTGAGYYAITTNNFDAERGGITIQVSCATNTLATALTINYLGAATFSSSVTATSATFGNTSNDTNAIQFLDAASSKTHIGSAFGATFIQNNNYFNGTSYVFDDNTKPSANVTLSAGTINFQTGAANANPTTKFMITSGGQVGIRITPCSGWGSAMAAIQLGCGAVIDSWTGTDSVMGVGVNYFDNGAGSQLRLYAKGTSRIGFNEDVITFSNAPSSTVGSVITFSERMRITSGGQVQIKQGNNTFNDGLRFINTSNNYWGFVAGGDNNLYLGYNSPSVSVGNFNSSTGVYTATSDINKKKDFEQSNIGLNAVLGLKPTLYRMKTEDEDTDKHLGFIAQEVKEFIPQAYSESINGDSVFIGLTEMPIIAALVKAIQEQQCKIKILESCLGIN